MTELFKATAVCKYFGGLKAVDNVDVSVTQGQIYGIIGPNGAGKTTLFNVCSGIYRPTSGSILFNGQEISAKRPEQICRLGIARTFQTTQLFKYMSVLENVVVGCHTSTVTNMFDAIAHTGRYKQDEKLANEKSMQILERTGLVQYMDEKAGNLSYGIQRRVEIARALATDPKLLMLDEPAAGMNPVETNALMEFIMSLRNDGYTILLIEHDMKFVMNSCQRITVLNFGKKICEGTPDEVKNNRDVQTAYFGSGMMAQEV